MLTEGGASLVVMTDSIGCCGEAAGSLGTVGTMTDGAEEDIALSSSVLVASRTLSPTSELNNSHTITTGQYCEMYNVLHNSTECV